MRKWSVRIDAKKNRIYVDYGDGNITNDEMKRASERFTTLFAQLKPNMTVLSDASGLSNITPELEDIIVGSMKTLATSGASKIARVAPTASYARGQLRRASDKAGYRAKVFDTLVEAEKWLDE